MDVSLLSTYLLSAKSSKRRTLTAVSSPEQAVTRVRILRYYNVATAAISHWSVSEIDTQLNESKNTKTKKNNVTLAEKCINQTQKFINFSDRTTGGGQLLLFFEGGGGGGQLLLFFEGGRGAWRVLENDGWLERVYTPSPPLPFQECPPPSLQEFFFEHLVSWICAQDGGDSRRWQYKCEVTCRLHRPTA